MLIHSRGNQYNDDPRARESAHLDANDVAPICPVISLHSRGNQYNDAFRLSNCFALLGRIAIHARGNQYISNDIALLARVATHARAHQLPHEDHVNLSFHLEDPNSTPADDTHQHTNENPWTCPQRVPHFLTETGFLITFQYDLISRTAFLLHFVSIKSSITRRNGCWQMRRHVPY